MTYFSPGNPLVKPFPGFLQSLLGLLMEFTVAISYVFIILVLLFDMYFGFVKRQDGMNP
jgi:hypothetical protein